VSALRSFFFVSLLRDYHIVEFAVLTLDAETNQPKAKIYRPSDIDALLVAEGLTKKDEDTEMKST